MDQTPIATHMKDYKKILIDFLNTCEDPKVFENLNFGFSENTLRGFGDD